MSAPDPTAPAGVSAEYRSERDRWVSQEAKEKLEWGAEQAARLWEKLYAPHDPQIDGRVVLDLGCSWGYLLKHLSERFKPALLIGSDVKPWWELRDHGWNYAALGDQIRFHAGDLPEIEAIAPRSVDLILCASVLQYMTPEQVEANLVRAYDLLRPGGRMILRTRCFTSYIGADLHRDVETPYVHLFHGEDDLARFLHERRGGKEPPYLNFLTVSSYISIIIRSGFEIVSHFRRPNGHAPEMQARVAAAYPWISAEELNCAELEASLVRAIEPEDIAEFGDVVRSRKVEIADFQP